MTVNRSLRGFHTSVSLLQWLCKLKKMLRIPSEDVQCHSWMWDVCQEGCLVMLPHREHFLQWAWLPAMGIISLVLIGCSPQDLTPCLPEQSTKCLLFWISSSEPKRYLQIPGRQKKNVEKGTLLWGMWDHKCVCSRVHINFYLGFSHFLVHYYI